MINTYNESPLHKTLKSLYAARDGGKTEYKEGNFIFDIAENDGSFTEIQTANISALRSKILYALSNGKKIKVIHPVIETNFIELYEGGKLLSRRKSPKSKTIYSVLRELTGIYDLILDKNFSLELLFVETNEKRIKTEEKIQLQNKSRRFLKNWIPAGRTLVSINSSKILKTREDYFLLIPSSLRSKGTFTSKELFSAIFNDEDGILGATPSKSQRNDALKNGRILLWFLKKLKFINETGLSGHSKVYKITEKTL